MGLWRDVILRYHTVNKIKQLLVYDCELWRNEEIDRGLDREEIKSVVEDFVRSGHGEWEDAAKTRIKVLWKKPEELASDLYLWAERNGFIGQVCTLYELSAGEDAEGASFEGADDELIRRALKILEDQGQCTIFKGDTSEEDGVKFF
ncbi:hypothetical protein TrRE_jg6680 [Triparma retinervis]|uniref:ESCRT-II complex subunit VPS25 n=1 Tax=Triparma retinervis TaxID=2557542 RepID=A0A9W7EAU1_9STRA|nr:hypothetical protein TrRE_jg6680 [Triparma retinervis]